MIWPATLSACPAFGWAKSILMRPGRTTVVTLGWFLDGASVWERVVLDLDEASNIFREK